MVLYIIYIYRRGGEGRERDRETERGGGEGGKEEGEYTIK